MSQIVKLRRSSTGGNRPTNSQLQLGELAINTTDGKLYFAKSGSLSASIEEVVTTNAQNTGSLNLSGSFNLIGTENITGSLNTTGSLRVLGDTSLTSLVVSGSDPVANVQAFVPDSTIYNVASFNTPDRVAAGIRFNWSNENWTIGAARGLTTDVDGLVFSRNGVRQMLLDENNNLVLSGSINLTGSFNVNGTEYTATTSGTSGSNGTNGSSGSSGTSGVDGFSGTSGSSGTNGTSGSNGTNGSSGSSGSNGTNGTSGSNGTNGSSGSSGSNGTNGSSGSSGSSGLTGANGTSGTSGSNGTNGSSGTSGSNGTNGSSGTSGTNGSSGSNGTNGSSGTSGDSLFALTGSVWETTNNAKVNGDLTITGTLTAKEIHTALVTSSVLYESGSTAFGNTFDDNHNFTGSVKITGSLYVNGAVVGTGKLDESWFNSYVSSSTTTIASSSYALTASHALNAVVLNGQTKTQNFSVAATTWSFNHQMGVRYPSIQIFDNNGFVVIPSEIVSIDTNNISVYFPIAQTGTISVTVGGAGTAGTSGTSGNGTDGSSGTSGVDGFSGTSGSSGSSGTSGGSGSNGTSGTSGRDGIGGATQTFASLTTWSVFHNLDIAFPVVTVWDDSRSIIIPSRIQSVDNNNLNVYFPVPISGSVNVVRGGHVVSGAVDLSAVGTIIPATNGSYDLGSSLKQFNNAYISGSILVNGVSLDNKYVLSGSITQTTWDNIGSKPSGIISGSSQIIGLGFATTGSNDLSGDRYLFTQSSTTGSWVITHNLGYQYPNVDVYDSSNQILIPQTVTAISTTSMQIDFATPTVGKAILTIGGAKSTGLFVQTGSFYNTTNNIGITGSLVVMGDVDAANFNTTSDKKLKTNLERIEGSLDKIAKLNGYTFDWIEGYGDDRTRQIGMIANEVYDVQPELIANRKITLNGKEEEIKLLDYSKVTALLIEAVKELNDKVKKLENKRNKK